MLCANCATAPKWPAIAASPSRSSDHGAHTEQNSETAGSGWSDDPLKVRAFDELLPGEALVVKGLGFTRLNQVVEREDTPSIRGMVAKVPHLVVIVKAAK
jgi:ribosomal protein L30